MENYEESRVKTLIVQDEELRVLWEEHVELKQRLAEMADRSHLTPSEELERKKLQKRKLVGKDRIAAILASHSG